YAWFRRARSRGKSALRGCRRGARRQVHPDRSARRAPRFAVSCRSGIPSSSLASFSFPFYSTPPRFACPADIRPVAARWLPIAGCASALRQIRRMCIFVVGKEPRRKNVQGKRAFLRYEKRMEKGEIQEAMISSLVVEE